VAVHDVNFSYSGVLEKKNFFFMLQLLALQTKVDECEVNKPINLTSYPVFKIMGMKLVQNETERGTTTTKLTICNQAIVEVISRAHKQA